MRHFFQPGDKVVCIDKGSDRNSLSKLKEDEELTVIQLDSIGNNPCIRLQGLRYVFFERRFKLVERDGIRAGTKVKCIDNKESSLELNKIYTCAGFASGPSSFVALILEEHPDDTVIGFYARRFQPVNKPMRNIEQQNIISVNSVELVLAIASYLKEKNFTVEGGIRGTNEGLFASCIKTWQLKIDGPNRKLIYYNVNEGNGRPAFVTLKAFIDWMNEAAPKKAPKIGEYQPEVKKNGLHVGCQIISWETFDELCEYVKEARAAGL